MVNMLLENILSISKPIVVYLPDPLISVYEDLEVFLTLKLLSGFSSLAYHLLHAGMT